MAGGGNTWDVTSEDAEEAGEGGCNKENKGEGRGLMNDGKTRLASPLEWGAERGTPRPPEWQETPGGICQGGGGEVDLPRGIDTHGLEDLPRGKETSGVNPEGDGVPEEGGRGRGRDGKSPDTRYTKASGDISSNEEITSGPGLAGGPRP